MKGHGEGHANPSFWHIFYISTPRDLLAKLESQMEMLPRAAVAHLPLVASNLWIFLQPLPPVASNLWIFLQPLLPQMSSSQWLPLQPLPAPPGSPRLGGAALRQEMPAHGRDSSPKRTDTNNKGQRGNCKCVALQVSLKHLLQIKIYNF